MSCFGIRCFLFLEQEVDRVQHLQPEVQFCRAAESTPSEPRDRCFERNHFRSEVGLCHAADEQDVEVSDEPRFGGRRRPAAAGVSLQEVQEGVRHQREPAAPLQPRTRQTGEACQTSSIDQLPM